MIAAAQSDWQAAERDRAEHRLYGAMDRLARLARVAADVPGPSAASASDQLSELAATKAIVQAQIASARALPDSQKEAAIGQILAVAADCAEAIDLLSALPLAPPARLLVELKPDAVMLAWNAPTTQGPLTYKVVRLTSAPDGTALASRVLGTTTSTEFEDAGVPGGVLVAYEVTALSARRASVAVSTTPMLMARDVMRLIARAAGRDVTLTWSLPLSYGVVVVERTADPASGLSLPPRRARAEGQTWTDVSPSVGVEFTYHVRAEYRDGRGVLFRTPGAVVTATVTRG